MSDDEIIKALECCSVHPMKCKKCPYKGNERCTNAHRKDALDLINRQKAEIESLKESLQYGNEICENCQADKDKGLKKAKTGAIKEFAKRLKSKAIQKYDWNEYVEIEDIDNLAEEMERENDR